VYYVNLDSWQLLRVSIEGGKSEEVPGTSGLVNGTSLGFSPDGKLLAFFRSSKDSNTGPGQIVLTTLDRGQKPQLKFLDVDPRFRAFSRFAPDGKAMVFTIHESGADNLWLQPLDGSKGRPITNFTDDEIQYFAYSPDGKTLGVMRTHTDSDVVLLRTVASSD
jgi:Tol biopolymer transport system component